MCKMTLRRYSVPRWTAPGTILFLAISVFVAPAINAQPSDSLMLYLEFEGDVLDSSGNSYDGTIWRRCAMTQPCCFIWTVCYAIS